jgi:hypothetical protein
MTWIVAAIAAALMFGALVAGLVSWVGSKVG